MILVILGAGASYDSAPTHLLSEWSRNDLPDRPPLANELFEAKIPAVMDALSLFPECRPIVPLLMPPLDGNRTIENVLQNLVVQSEADVSRKRQLAAVRVYLQFVIRQFETKWKEIHKGITNYVALLDQVRRARGPNEPVCLVTFNYDCMIEDAMDSLGITIASFDDYLKDSAFKLFKLHGSVNWGKEVIAPFDRVDIDRNVWEVIRELIHRAEELKLSSEFRFTANWPIGKIDEVPLFPALAIPIVTKSEFECPVSHLDCLKNLLPETRTVLTIGWRGMEKHFLGMLAASLSGKPAVRACSVARSSEEAKGVLDQFKTARISVNGVPYSQGFTEFIKSERAESVCGTNEQNWWPPEKTYSSSSSESANKDPNTEFDVRSGNDEYDVRAPSKDE